MENTNQQEQVKTKIAKAKKPPVENSHHVDVENAYREKVNGLIAAQKQELDEHQLLLAQVQLTLDELEMRRKLAKKALKKGKDNKLGKKKLDLIRKDLDAIKEQRKLVKQLIKAKTKRTEELLSVILLLESII